ncbi:efflux transporter outer membrane subunit [Duganella sp. FT80W]|uniref:Efflux transporter outer membrane subunit n=2 Tax=Duganella guangzhouensis TaxID=2666084 RepID=A0A6I2L011_9BURK|nr:efflux transporter outer membrane subunit [Duganella guangzhouensis]
MRPTLRPTLLCATLAMALLSGCANLAPTYQRPDAPVANNWPQTATANTSDAPASAGAPANHAAAAEAPLAVVADQLGWSDFIADDRLRQVVALSLANNRDLRVAALNIDKARAQYRVQDAARYPVISVSGGSTRTHSAGSTSSDATATVGLTSYELDFFGKAKNLSEEALQSYLNLAETKRSTQISLVAEVATAWLTLAADQARLALAQETLASQRQTYELQQASHDLGGTSGLTLSQTQSTVESARVDVATYQTQVAQDRNALTLLVGAAVPVSLLPDASAGAPDAANASVLVGVTGDLPSSVLQRRPDVLAAEHTLKSANADIGVARAAFFPSITLTASAGTASSALSGLFAAGSGAWTFAPAISLPIFNAGSNQATLDAAKITQQIQVATYEKTIQTAFQEVADALAARAVMADKLAAQQSLVAATDRSFQLSTAMQRNGGASYLDVLDSQRSLYTAQQTAITLRLAEQTNRVTLYKVLGGGADAASAPLQASKQ